MISYRISKRQASRSACPKQVGVPVHDQLPHFKAPDRLLPFIPGIGEQIKIQQRRERKCLSIIVFTS
jgi:hypothetical protein